MHGDRDDNVLLALLQKLVGELFDFLQGGLAGICGIRRTHKIKAQIIRAQFWSIFRKKIRTRYN